MAKTALAATDREDRSKSIKADSKPGENLIVGRVGSSYERARTFLTDVRAEMRKVVTPSRKEVQATTTVVLVTVFIFAFYFWAVDSIFTVGLNRLLTNLVGPQ